MGLKTYPGSCHCGAVHFEADIDLAEGTTRCNCSICTKARAWFALVPAERVRVLSGADALAEYRWTPPGKPHPHLDYRFCRTCGTRTFAHGEEPEGGVFYAIAIASLDRVDAEELAASPMKYVDGRHDRYDRWPEDLRFL